MFLFFIVQPLIFLNILIKNHILLGGGGPS